mgnify:CR=1 FL=1
MWRSNERNSEPSAGPDDFNSTRRFIPVLEGREKLSTQKRKVSIWCKLEKATETCTVIIIVQSKCLNETRKYLPLMDRIGRLEHALTTTHIRISKDRLKEAHNRS